MDIEGLTLKEVFEKTKSIPINEGGLSLILEKIVMEIQQIKEANHEIIKALKILSK